MLRDLGIESVRLMTNNPAKGDSLIAAGIPVTEYVPVIVGIAAQNAGYLETKRDRMGHMIPSEG
jgi:3,4-dihydroxy 2-butanone 4-phosphate synthase/GTP cyclohydrolase II